MIIVNNKIVELPVKLVAELKDEIGKGKKIKFPDSLSRKVQVYDGSGNATGRFIQESPQMRNFPLSETLLLDEKTMLPSPNGLSAKVTVGQALKIENGVATSVSTDKFSRPVTIKPEDYELYWFLKYISRFIKNGEGGKRGKTHHFEIEDKKASASGKITAMREKSKTEAFLTADENENGVTSEKLNELGRVYRLVGLDEMSRDEIVYALLEEIKRDEQTKEHSFGSDKSGYAFFNEICNDKEESAYRVLAQKCVDNEIIAFKLTEKSWHYVSDKTRNFADGYYGSKIFKVLGDERHFPALINKIKASREFFDELTELLNGGQMAVSEKENKLTKVEELREQASSQGKSGQIEDAIKTWEEIARLDPSLKQTANQQIGRLKNR